MIQIPRSIGVVLIVMAFLVLRLAGGGAAAVAVPKEPAKEQKGQPKLRHDLADADKGIRAVAFSRDGKTLATAGADIKLWDMVTGKEKKTFAKGHDAIVMAVAFSPDDKTLISAGADGLHGAVHLWHVETGKQKPAPNGFGKKPSLQEYLCVVASRDGKTVAAAGWGGDIFLWNVATGKRTDLKGHLNSIFALSLSRDGKLLASGSSDANCKVWDLTTGKVKATLAEKDWGTTPSLALSAVNILVLRNSMPVGILRR
jgi:WD40 repeat protein